MPRFATPRLPTTERQDIVLGIFGINPTRAALIRQLAVATEGHTSGELAEQIGVAYQTLLAHLRKLEAGGLVHVSDDARPLYSIDRHALDAALGDAVDYFNGNDGADAATRRP